ncbi:MAG: peptidoglycan-binding domain-containing protein [Candidatus Staskawiczbacteria bacterium]|nr:peptidoglycan-binding domain-containing protein [Candidatus Staskawiczbacteria bacterium]
MKTHKDFKKIILIAAILLFFVVAFSVKAVNVGDSVSFNVDKNFDASARAQITATLVKTGNNLYFYVEKTWWDAQPQAKQSEILAGLDSLSSEFDNKIYPTLTSVFGSEFKPGVDGDSRITVLFEVMNSNEGGYFRTTDEYIKLQLPNSNEREMVYLSLDHFSDSYLKIFLAHEFVHLITFNQKNKNFNVEDDTWLNEARADYSSTILGYDDRYEGSNLQQRVNDFVKNPSDSITEWTGTKYDYASASLFMHYLTDHYGINILIDSLKSKYVGIDSINYALQKSAYQDTFAQIFTNWTTAVVLNNCSIGQKYCYLNQNLKNLRLSPSLNFLPLTGNVSLSVTNVTKSWTGNWLKFIGGNGDLKLDFSSLKGLSFQIPYIIEDSAGSYAVKFLALDENEKGEINISKFGSDYKSLVIIPSLQSQIYKSDDLEPTYPFSYTVSVTGSAQVADQALIQQLLNKIADLKKQIAEIQAQIDNAGGQNYCLQLNSNLYFGIQSNNDVKCLQNFLKNLGADIYPEGLVTGNFGSLTKNAVIKFQEKYASEILIPSGLTKGTGYVGPATRAKINKILAGT